MNIEVQEDHDRRYLVNVYPFEDLSRLKFSIDWAAGSGAMQHNATRTSGSMRDLVSALGGLSTSDKLALADALLQVAHIEANGKSDPPKNDDFESGRNRGRQEAVGTVDIFLKKARDDARSSLGTPRGDSAQAVVARLQQLKDQIAGH